MRKIKIVILSFIICSHILSQTALGEWRDHLPYNNVIRIAEVNDKIYCAISGGAIFYYNKSDNSVNKISKVNGLSDISISAMRYTPEKKIIIVGYENSNIDLINENNEIYNIPDLKFKQFSGKKNINNILFINNKAYLACGFGILVINLDKKEISEQYYIGTNGSQIEVFDLTYDGTYIYAATETGVYKALAIGKNLIDYNNWSLLTELPNYNSTFNCIRFFNNKIFINYKNTNGKDIIYSYDYNKVDTFIINSFDKTKSFEICYNNFVITGAKDSLSGSVTIFNTLVRVFNSSLIEINNFKKVGWGLNHSIIDNLNEQWLGTEFSGLVLSSLTNYLTLYPNGPRKTDVTDISIVNDSVWVAGGAQNVTYDFWKGEGIYKFINEKWYNPFLLPIPGVTKDVGFPKSSYIVKVDPTNSEHVWVGSSGYGLIEYNTKKSYNIIYNTQNSLLESILPSDPHRDEFIRVLGMEFDKNNILWLSCSEVPNPLYGVEKRGDSTIFYHPKLKYDFNIKQKNKGMVVTSDNSKWFLLFGGSICSFNENSTLTNDADNKERVFKIQNQDNKQFDQVNCITSDRNGDIWVGTSEGPVIYNEPESVFEDETVLGYQVKLSRNDGTDLADYLLGNEFVNAIAIDGANRKWIATRTSGVYLISEDGTKELNHFTVDNSPLFSNNVYTIAVNHRNGEVFFGTEKGIISFKGDATLPNNDFKDAYVYPNPVRHEYQGPIAITGLVNKCNVKITDINGNIVYDANALGGQVVWDGKNYNGKRVQTGVYLIFCSNEDGSKTHILKLLFIN